MSDIEGEKPTTFKKYAKKKMGFWLWSILVMENRPESLPKEI